MRGNGACGDGHGCGRGCGHDRGCETETGSASCRDHDLCRQIGLRARRRRGSARSTSLRGRGSGKVLKDVSNCTEKIRRDVFIIFHSPHRPWCRRGLSRRPQRLSCPQTRRKQNLEDSWPPRRFSKVRTFRSSPPAHTCWHCYRDCRCTPCSLCPSHGGET